MISFIGFVPAALKSQRFKTADLVGHADRRIGDGLDEIVEAVEEAEMPASISAALQPS